MFSRLTRGGAWELPERSSWRSVFGTIYLDLREVRLGSAEVRLSIYNLFGTVRVRVPPASALEVTGGGAFASQVIDTATVAGAPRRAAVANPRVRTRRDAVRQLVQRRRSPTR